MFSSLEGKNVLVTGAEKGIGKAIAKKFVENKARVAIVGIDVEAGNKTAKELGERAGFYETDVSDENAVKVLTEKIKDDMGNIQILVNNAGVLMTGNVVEVEYQDWKNLMKVNLDGVFLMCKHFIEEHMLPAGEGTIVNIGSEAGIDAFSDQVAYNVSKAAVIHLTKSIAVDFAEKGIRANAVCPGTTHTPLVEEALKNADDPEKLKEDLETIRPLNRLGEPDEIASAVVSIAADELAYATGSVFSIDGGKTAE